LNDCSREEVGRRREGEGGGKVERRRKEDRWKEGYLNFLPGEGEGRWGVWGKFPPREGST